MPPRHGVVRRLEPMARHSVWGVGGIADTVFWPASREDLARFLSMLPLEEPLTWVGLGSNLLVRDGGIRGTVIVTVNGLSELSFVDEHTVHVESGVPCAKVARVCARRGLLGAEFLAGIPGTMGGALAMNAGCFGGETWRLVRSVETIDRTGMIRTRDPDDFSVDYRQVCGGSNEWFLSANLELEIGSSEIGKDKIKLLLRQRADSQPTGQRSCGSVFKNPPGDFAGRLIESAGLKGLRIGNASVSTKHANFIINDGEATASDIEALIQAVQKSVHESTGVRLACEVQIVGDPA